MRSVLWLGGAPCAGKSSVARWLGERFALDVVHVDDTIGAFMAQLDPERQPALSGWMALNWDERWARPPDVLLGEVVACYREHLGFVRERVLTRAGRRVGGVVRVPRRPRSDRRLRTGVGGLVPRLARDGMSWGGARSRWPGRVVGSGAERSP